MSVEGLSVLLAAIITAALCVAMLIRAGRNRLYLSFSAVNGVLFAYYLTSFIHVASEESIWFRLNILAALAIPPSAIRFFTIFLGRSDGLAGRATRLSLTISILLSPFALSAWIEVYVVKLLVLSFVVTSLLLCLLMILERLRHTTSRVASVRLKYLLYGGLVALILSLSGFLPGFEVPWFPAMGNMVTVIYMYFLSQIIIQYRLLDLNELVGKMLVLAVLVTVLATIYSLIGLFVSDIPGLVFFNTFLAGFVMLILFDPVNRLIEDRVNRLLFRERYEFGRELAQLRRELANVIDVQEMVQRILTRLEDSRRVTSASIFLLEDGTNLHRCLGYVGPPPQDNLDIVTERRFLDRLSRMSALVVEAVEAEVETLTAPDQLSERDTLAEVLRVMEVLEADVCLSIVSNERVIGLLNVRDDRMSESYSPEEIAHLAAIANQAGICVENSRIVTDVRHRDRLAAIGEMAAGLAHEVRNPLGAIKGAAQMLADDDEIPTEDGTREFIEIIVEEVNRLNKVVSAFLDYAKPYDGRAGPTEVNPVIERVGTLLRTHAEESSFDLDTVLDTGLPPVVIDPEVLRQVLWNLCLNALEAMVDSPAKRLTVTTRKASHSAPIQGGHFGREAVAIDVTDAGPGIPGADLERIFIPFYTTKGDGTGLGLAICQRLIRAAGGNINVRNEPGGGATFTIHLAIWTEDGASTSAERQRSPSLRSSEVPAQTFDPGLDTGRR